jgi:hypothetical protein
MGICEGEQNRLRNSNFFASVLFTQRIVKISVDKSLSARERIVSRADKFRFCRIRDWGSYRYSAWEISVSACGNLDTAVCLPYPHPLIIRVLSKYREDSSKRR